MGDDTAKSTRLLADWTTIGQTSAWIYDYRDLGVCAKANHSAEKRRKCYTDDVVVTI